MAGALSVLRRGGRELGGDGVVDGADLDLAGLSGLDDRDSQGQNPVFESGLDPIRIQAFSQIEPSGECSLWAAAAHQAAIVGSGQGTVDSEGEGLLLDSHIGVLLGDTGYVDGDQISVFFSINVGGHEVSRAGAGTARPAVVIEWIKSVDHVAANLLMIAACVITRGIMYE